MPVTIEIHNVPDDLHRELTARAAEAGMSLPDFLLAEIRESAKRQTVDMLRRRIARRATVTPSMPPAEAVRRQREAR